MSAQTYLRHLLVQLQSEPDSLSWHERRDLARHVVEAVAAGHHGSTARDLADLLARDRKWEVRREIAAGLLYLTAKDDTRLAMLLLKDANAYVRQAAEQAVDRRRQAAREAGLTQRATDHVEELIRRLESRFGRQASDKARQVCERYGELLAGSLVHDLRSILTHVKGNYQALMNDAAAKGVSRRTLARVQDDLDFLEQVVGDMATFTQSVPPERSRERLSDLVQAAILMAKLGFQRHGHDAGGISIEVDVPEGLTAPMARHLIVLALANVIKNALEAFVAADGVVQPGVVRISGRPDADAVVVTVADNGKGIVDGEVVGRSLLIPGRRNKTKRHSTGYGLPIAQRNLAAHGGSLTIDSRENQGTTVTLTLPTSCEDADEPTSISC